MAHVRLSACRSLRAQPLNTIRLVHQTLRLRSSWEGPRPDQDLAVKRIRCSNRSDVEYFRRELEVLFTAEDWDHCIGGLGAYGAAWRGKDGVQRGTAYYLTMPCGPTARLLSYIVPNVMSMNLDSSCKSRPARSTTTSSGAAGCDWRQYAEQTLKSWTSVCQRGDTACERIARSPRDASVCCS